MTMRQPDPDEMLGKHAGMLAEHFDGVLIIVSRVAPSGCTEMYVGGSGNWFSRVGMAREFLIADKNFSSIAGPPDDSPESDGADSDEPE